jgi:hypothetical protein
MPLVPILAGSDATAATINAALDAVMRTAYQAVDSSPVNNSTVLVSSTYLTLPVAASTTYLFDGVIFYDATAAADFKNSLALPVGSTGLASPWGSDTAAASVSATIEHDAFTSLTWATGGVASGTVMCSRPTGKFSTDTLGGSVTFQFAQNVANVSNAILKAGSSIRLIKVT